MFFRKILWRPIFNRDRSVEYGIPWRFSGTQCRQIYKRFECGPRLADRLSGAVKLTFAVILSANEGANAACAVEANDGALLRAALRI